jgi:microcystin-dependent protein
MPWSGGGIFTRVYSWVADKAAGLDILSGRMDTDSNDIASGIGLCLTSDGQRQPQANLPMAGFRHTGVANGIAATDYATMGQLQSQTGVNWSTDTGSVNAMAAAYTPAVTALVDGMLLFVRAANTNTSGTVTFAPNGLTAHSVQRIGGGLNPGDITINQDISLRYFAAGTTWLYINAPSVSSGQISASAVNALAGYTLCDGRAVARTNVGLFTVIGTTYGAGDGSTTFNVPDMRGYVPAGVDPSSTRLSGFTTVASVGGAATVTLAVAALPAHTHSGTTAIEAQSITFGVNITSGIEGATHTHASFAGNNFAGTTHQSVQNTTPTVDVPSSAVQNLATGVELANHTHAVTGNTGFQNNSHTHTFNTDNGTGGAGAHANVQPTQAVFWMIKN